MKKTFLAPVLFLPLTGCAHQQGGYAGGGSGDFAHDPGRGFSLQSIRRTLLRHGGASG